MERSRWNPNCVCGGNRLFSKWLFVYAFFWNIFYCAGLILIGCKLLKLSLRLIYRPALCAAVLGIPVAKARFIRRACGLAMIYAVSSRKQLGNIYLGRLHLSLWPS